MWLLLLMFLIPTASFAQDVDQVKVIDNSTIEVSRTDAPKESSAIYDIRFLKNQLISIQKDEDEYVAKREAEKAEINTILNKSKDLGANTN